MDKYPVSCVHLGDYFQVDGKLLQQQYKEHISDYRSWEQREHATEWMVFPENTGVRLSIDETALSNGELYTIVTNKAAKGRKKALVAMIQGTQVDQITEVLEKIPERLRDMVEELAKSNNRPYNPEVLPNGDTLKQLLARSRYLLFRHHSKWSQSQKHRAELLFEKFPEIKEGYSLSIKLGDIFKNAKAKEVAFKKLALWYNEAEAAGIESFRTVARSLHVHYINILNFFNNRSTNASAESFNAKIKAFRATSRGVRDINFFLFRLSNIYA